MKNLFYVLLALIGHIIALLSGNKIIIWLTLLCFIIFLLGYILVEDDQEV